MSRQTSSYTPQEALRRLVQADKEAEAQVQEAAQQAQEIVDQARRKAESNRQEARSEAEAEAEQLIKEAESKAEAEQESWLQEHVSVTRGNQVYLTEVETLRQQADQNWKETVEFLVAWVTGQEV